MTRSLVGALVATALGCAPGDAQFGEALSGGATRIEALSPTTILPGTTVVLAGHQFKEDGEYSLRVNGGGTKKVTKRFDLIGEEGRALWEISPEDFAAFGEGSFNGRLEVVTMVHGRERGGGSHDASLRFVRQLHPKLEEIDTGLIHINTAIGVKGEGLLLGDGEGTAMAEIEGCFLPAGRAGPCSERGKRIEPTPVPFLTPDQRAGHGLPALPSDLADEERLDGLDVADELLQKQRRRDEGAFPFSPKIAGLSPGRFEGTVTIANHHTDGTVHRSGSQEVAFEVAPSYIEGFAQEGISLGRFLEVRGRGFVDQDEETDSGTILSFEGTLRNPKQAPQSVSFEITPMYVDGGRVRFAIEDDEDGYAFDGGLRLRDRGNSAGGCDSGMPFFGTLTGTWTLTVMYRDETYTSEAVEIPLKVLPTKQVVWVRFRQAWDEGLKAFGLLAADDQVRRRVIEVLQAAYKGVNVEFRVSRPRDFHQFSELSIVGNDTNFSCTTLLGLETTPGKDRGNSRLNDIVGGYHADTAEPVVSDNALAGFAGVFTMQFFGVSAHPPRGICRFRTLQDPLFDQLFDPVRPDMGRVATTVEVRDAPPLDEETARVRCPASNRRDQVGCAIRVFGNIVGAVASHELGHSLGLSLPMEKSALISHEGEDNVPNRIMDQGDQSSFMERAQLGPKNSPEGGGPRHFCKNNYVYLRKILPGDEEPDISLSERPACTRDYSWPQGAGCR